MGTIGVHINYRPLRVGFCIKDQDFDALRQVGIINSYLSGGLFNPIIVISDSDNEEKIKDKVLSIRPDILHVIDDKLKEKLKLFNRDYLPRPFDLEQGILCEYEEKTYFQVLDVDSIIRNIWERYMKVSSQKYSNAILPKWQEDDELALLFTLIFGKFGLSGEFTMNYERAYLKGLRARELNIEKGNLLAKELFTKVTPLLFSTEDLNQHYIARHRGMGFIIGRSNNFNDLVSFWNFRSNNPDAFFLPIECIDRFKSCIEAIRDNVITLSKQGKQSSHLDYMMYFSQDNENVAKDIQNKYFSNPQVFRTKLRDNLYEARYNLVHFDDQPTQGDIETTRNGHFSLKFQLPDFKYSEKRFYPKRFFAISFSFITEFEYPKHTLQLPNFCDLNEWYARKVCFHYDRMRVEPKGFAIITEDNTNFQTLQPLSLSDLLGKLFERSKLSISPSKAGKIGYQIIEQMRDIEGCRVFKITGVRDLLRSLSPLSNRTRKQCCDKIKDKKNNSFLNFEDLYIEARKAPKLTPEMAFDFLVNKKVFRAGALIKCTRCDLESWVPLREFSDLLQCPLCDNKFSPLEENKSGITWHFRRSGLFGEYNNQEGSIPVLLSLLQLVRVKHDARIFTGHDVEFNGNKCELDLIALDVNQHYFDSTPEIIIGECKDAGLRDKERTQPVAKRLKERYQVTDKDISNMIEIKKRLDSSGLRTWLLFSTTASMFSLDEIARFQGLTNQHIYPILFTANELEPYHPYDRYDRNKLQHSHAINYDQLAANSQFIYLEGRNPLSLLSR